MILALELGVIGFIVLDFFRDWCYISGVAIRGMNTVLWVCSWLLRTLPKRKLSESQSSLRLMELQTKTGHEIQS